MGIVFVWIYALSSLRHLRPQIEAGTLTREEARRFALLFASFMTVWLFTYWLAARSSRAGLADAWMAICLTVVLVWIWFGAGAETLARFAPGYGYPPVTARTVRIVITLSAAFWFAVAIYIEIVGVS